MADEKTIQSSSAVLLAEERLLNYIWLNPELLDREEYKALKLERVYYRSREGSPFDFTQLAGD